MPWLDLLYSAEGTRHLKDFESPVIQARYLPMYAQSNLQSIDGQNRREGADSAQSFQAYIRVRVRRQRVSRAGMLMPP